VQSFGLLLVGVEVLNHPPHRELFDLHSMGQLQTVMFLQLVAGGHLLLFITRTDRWFFLPPFPAAPLFWAIVLTQVVAIVMCAAGWLVAPISWKLIVAVWVYNLAWIFVMGGIRLATERFVDFRTARQLKSANTINQVLYPQAQAFATSAV
jgi:H+-transporting ATPase